MLGSWRDRFSVSVLTVTLKLDFELNTYMLSIICVSPVRLTLPQH